MHMNNDAGIQTRQDLQEKVVHIAADLYGVRTVDEENVAGLQFEKKNRSRVSHFLLHQTSDPENLGRKKSSGKGSMQIERCVAVLAAAFPEISDE